MSVTVLLEVAVKPNVDLIGMMKQMLPDTRSFDGCEGVEVTQNQDDSNNIVLIEKWASRDHYDKYIAWRTERGDMDTLGASLAGPPSIRYFDTADA